MTPQNIPLESLRPEGFAQTQKTKEGLQVSLTRSIPTERFDKAHLRILSYVAPQQVFHMPLRIDLQVKIDAPGLYVLLGDGHVNFGTDWSDNCRIGDPVEPKYKPLYFDNRIPTNQFVTLSLLYDPKGMQVLVDGQERYISFKERYMRSKLFEERNAAGFPLRITCDKGTHMVLRALTITENPEGAGIVTDGQPLPPLRQGNPAVQPGEKPTFEGCISQLPAALRQELTAMDAQLRSMRPLRFRRQLEKHGNKISYVASEYGLSYAVHPSGPIMHHTLQWYILTGSKPELWHQKADHMVQVLQRLQQQDPALAERLFASLKDCVGCVPGCRVPRAYTFGDQKRVACHGKLQLTMRLEDLQAAMAYLHQANALMTEQAQGRDSDA